MQVIKGIRLFGGAGFSSNIYLIDGEILVDTGIGDFFPEIKNEIAALGFNPRDIHTIVNTHHHFDHTGGDKKFRDWLMSEGSEAVIAIHSADRAALEHGETLAELFGAHAKIVTAGVGLEDGDVLETEKSGLKFEVIHTPGHTPGSICLYERKKRILISGDTLFEDGFGRTDLPGGNAEEIEFSLKKIFKLNPEYLLPGHGNVKMSGVGFLIKQILSGNLRPKEKHR